MSEVAAAPPPPPPPPPPPVHPPTGLPPGGVPPGQFDFGAPFTYVFDDPRWAQKILVGGLFYLAGFFIVGWFFLLGYVAQTTRNVIAGVQRPLPEWEDLGGFFTEGLRLFAVGLCYIVPFIGIVIAFAIPAGILGAFENEGMQVLGSGIAGCMACLILPLSLLVAFFMPASMLFAIVEQRFGAAFEFGRIWPFIRDNIGNYLLSFLIYWIARTLGGMGVIFLCIGVIFTGFWALLITANAFAQVYRVAKR